MNKDRLINLILILGVIIGILLAILSSIKETNFNFDDEWVAKVGDTEISRAKYMLQLEGLSFSKRDLLKEEDKAFVLERMIEEELLIQRAKDLGMMSTNTMIRGTIVQQMINMIIAENSLELIEPDELKKFYKENKTFFTSADRLRVKQIYFAEEKGKSFDRAMEAYKELAEGESLEKVIKDSDESILQVPDTLMNLSKLREYIGPSLMQIARNLQEGEFSSPKKVSEGYKIILVLERRDAFPPDFDQIRDRVKSEYKKRKDDEALRDYLNSLKKWYEIERHPKI